MAFNPQTYIDALDSDDPDTREDSLAVLSHAGITDALVKIGQMLIDDPGDKVRKEAAIALEIFQDPSTIDVLILGLNDEYWGVRLHAFLALKKLLGDNWRENEAIAAALAREQNHAVLHSLS